jgi:hypothetical protein
MSDSQPLTPGNEAPAGRPARSAEPSADAAVAPGPLHRSRYGQALSAGYGNAMGRGVELALTLVVFGAIGWLIDRLAGTSPLFTLIFSVVGFAGISVKLWLGYDLEMRRIESDAIWNRGSRPDGSEAGAS